MAANLYGSPEVEDIVRRLQGLSKALHSAVAVRQTKSRVIVKMAKNTQPGDVVDFPGWGTREVSGWSMADGVVTLSSGQYIATYPARQKVRIVREVPVA